MVDVLLLCREHGPDRVELAVRGALAAGAHRRPRRRGPRPPRRRPRRPPPAPLTGLEPRLAAHARPAPDLADYDQLLGGTR